MFDGKYPRWVVVFSESRVVFKVFKMIRPFILSSCGLFLMLSEPVFAVRSPKEMELKLIPGSAAGVMDPLGVSVRGFIEKQTNNRVNSVKTNL